MYVHRIIATGGQTINFNKGNVFVDEILLSENYVIAKTFASDDEKFPKIVPKDSYFVLGDNRSNSADSRDSDIGFISKNQIIGKVVNDK